VARLGCSRAVLSRAAFLSGALATVLLGTGCSLPVRAVPLPPDSASPRQVVAAVFEAWRSHDTSTLEQLYDPRFTAQIRKNPDVDLDLFPDATVVSISPGAVDDEAGLAGLRPGETTFGVGSTIEVHGVIGMNDGRNPLGFTLVQTGPHLAWRVLAVGDG
jgi:hypothetical protein